MIARASKKDLALLAELMEQDKLTAVIHKTLPDSASSVQNRLPARSI